MLIDSGMEPENLDFGNDYLILFIDSLIEFSALIDYLMNEPDLDPELLIDYLID